FVSVLGSIFRVLFSRSVGPRRLHSLAPYFAVLVWGFGGRWGFGNWGWSVFFVAFRSFLASFVPAIVGVMGKAQKLSKGTGFVPGYQHVVETMSESEGFGSSGRADSEDSSAPKRKCISLNVDRCGNFDVPFELFSLSKMSKSEKEELETRFRRDLDQVRMFQKKMFSRITISGDGVALSSSGDGYAKKQYAMGQNGSKFKCMNNGNLEMPKRAPDPDRLGNSYSLLMKQCETLLKRLMNHQYGWVFNTPVDPVKLNIPDYFQVIKYPMDFGTIKTRIQLGRYSNPWDFVSDVRLTFTNAKTYNPPKNDAHIMADAMSKFFETRWKPIEKKMVAANAAAKRDAETPKPILPPNKRKTPFNHEIILPEVVRSKMTVEEKESLSRRLESLGDMPEHVIDFLRRNMVASQTSADEVEIDLHAMSDDLLFELRKLLDDYMVRERLKDQVKSEPCEIEVGIELLDSDSGSSSESESDVKVASPMKDMKACTVDCMQELQMRQIKKNMLLSQNLSDNAPSERQLSPEKLYRAALLRSRFADTILKAREKTLDQVEILMRMDTELYFCCVLIFSLYCSFVHDFPFYILGYGEKRDPEKLRREREALERRKREEKARLQAEAKAAEEAQRLAEAEAAAQAAAEAKRRREFEREAARQALLQASISLGICVLLSLSLIKGATLSMLCRWRKLWRSMKAVFF
ncbi:hypothetical protein BHE74_00048156, partial [Ensete ventricosum]